MSRITKKQFRRDFNRGLGSALLELKTCDQPQQYYDIVEYGCLHNTTYDAQCEGDRGWYLYQAALSVGADNIENAVIEKYAHPFSDAWLFNQLTSILYHFAENGSIAARTALYVQYNDCIDLLSHVHIKGRTICNKRDMFDWLCVWLTSLDGWHAFKKIVSEVGERLIPRDKDFFFSEWFYDNSKSKFGKRRVMSYLSKQAGNSTAIQYFWTKAQEWDHHQYEELPAPTLEDVLAASTGERFKDRWLSVRFVRNANPNDLENLFHAAMSVQNLQKRAEILWGLRRARHPIPLDHISELLKSENEDIRETAIDIMEKKPSPKVREYALTLIEKGEDDAVAIRLLSRNLVKSDEVLLFSLVKSIPVKLTEGVWHSVFSSAEIGIESLKGKPKTDMLQYMYHQTLCSYCREGIVKLMHKKKVLTDTILQECLYDSNSDIRHFAELTLKRRNQLSSKN